MSAAGASVIRPPLIYLARHGETTWNVAGRYQGRRESPLSERGVAQARALGAGLAGATRFPRPARVVASPLLRCAETARIAAERMGLPAPPATTDERITEIAHGTWEGRLRDEIAANDPQTWRAWRETPERVRFDGGESLADVRARWRAFLASLDVDDRGDDAEGRWPLLVVTHDAVIRVALLEALRRPLHDFWDVGVENAAYAVLEASVAADERCNGDARRAAVSRWSVREECVVEHLAQPGLRAEIAGQAL